LLSVYGYLTEYITYFRTPDYICQRNPIDQWYVTKTCMGIVVFFFVT